MFLHLLIGISLFIIPLIIIYKINSISEKRKCEKCQRWQKASGCNKQAWNCPAKGKKIFDD